MVSEMRGINMENQNRGFKITSGGQTGVDRAALDATLELGIPCGGWCPKGRKALAYDLLVNVLK
jgi:hypothetical protein